MKHAPSCECAECQPKSVIHADRCECSECTPGPASHVDGCGCPDCKPKPVTHAASCGCSECAPGTVAHEDGCECPECGPQQAAHASGCECPDCEPQPAAHADSCDCAECQSAPGAAPSFSFRQEIQDEGTVLFLEGRLDAGAVAEKGDDLVAALGESSAISLDMTNLTYMASAGLRVLLMMQKGAAASGKKMRLENVQPLVRDVLEMSGMDRLFEIA